MSGVWRLRRCAGWFALVLAVAACGTSSDVSSPAVDCRPVWDAINLRPQTPHTEFDGTGKPPSVAFTTVNDKADPVTVDLHFNDAQSPLRTVKAGDSFAWANARFSVFKVCPGLVVLRRQSGASGSNAPTAQPSAAG